SGEPWFVPVALIIAWLLYVLRERIRWLYAITEIIVGIAAIASYIGSGRPGGLTQLLTVFGGIYIVVRGLDNFNQGLPTLLYFLPEGISGRIQRYWDLVFRFHRTHVQDQH